MKTIKLYITEIQPRLNVVHSISDNATTKINRYAPMVIENSKKIPVLSLVSFMAETYSILNSSENKYMNETKSHRLGYLIKYCSLSFLSFYL
jgi:hypothetical protein